MKFVKVFLKNFKKDFASFKEYFFILICYVFAICTLIIISDKNFSKEIGIFFIMLIIYSIIIFTIIFGILLGLSNVNLVNRIKKQIGVYRVLGVRKKKVYFFFLIKKLIVLFIASTLGIFLATILSKLMLMIIFTLSKNKQYASININFKELIITLIIISIFFIISEIKSYKLITSCELIELLKNKKEKVMCKNQSIFKCTLGIVLIITSYVLALTPLIRSSLDFCFLVLIINIIGTYFFFFSTIVILVSVLKKSKKLYYRGENLIFISDISNKLSSNAKILTINTVVIACAVTILSITSSIYYDTVKNSKNDYKFSFVITKDYTYKDDLDNIFKKYKDNKIILDKTIKTIRFDNKYHLNQVLGSKSGIVESYMDFISESDYRYISKVKNINIVEFESDECIIFKQSAGVGLYNFIEGTYMQSSKDNTNLKIKKQYNEGLINKRVGMDLVVVKDEIYNKIKSLGKTNVYRLIDVKNEYSSLGIYNELKGKNLDFNSYIGRYKMDLKTYGPMLFLGGFIFLILIICNGGTILLRQINSVYSEKEKYFALKNLGVSNNSINKIINKKIKTIFIVPLIIATLDNVFVNLIVEKLMGRTIFIPSLCSLICCYSIYIFIGYFGIKYYKNAVKFY